jgi:hypothetical protein
MNTDVKILKKYCKPNLTTYKKDVHCDQVGFIAGMQVFFNINSEGVLVYIRKIKDKNHMVIPIDAEED